MTKKIFIVFILFNLFSFGQQQTLDCKRILNKEPFFVRYNSSIPNDSVQIDYEIFKYCGKLDTVDMELLKGPIIGTILLKYPSKENGFTYKSILNSINKYKKTKDYSKYRDITITTKTLESKTVDLKEWEKDKALFIKLGVTGNELIEFKEFITKNDSLEWNYTEAFATYYARKNPPQNSFKEEKLKFAELVDINNAITTAQLHKKNAIIYFTCYACANARKMEDYVLTNPNVSKIIKENYIYFSAHVDDRRPDANNISTIGEKYQKIQSEKFNSQYQPYFFILDSSEKQKASMGMTLKTEEFILFLEKGLK